MGYLSNTQNIIDANGENWSIVKRENKIEFSCNREMGIWGSYSDDNYISFMTRRLTENQYPKVLVSGLGIGVVPQWLCENKNSLVDVVEIDTELVNSVNSMNYLHNNINIINADIYNYSTSEKYDLIYFDHWFFPNDSNFPNEKNNLLNLFQANKSENGIIVFPVHNEIF